MTIRKGAPWGEPAERPPDLRIAHTDAEVVDAWRSAPEAPVGLAGGDLHRSLGSPAPRREVQRLPIDLLSVDLDGREFVAAAHVVVRRSWWRGPLLAVMNVDHVGEWNVAPRAHPNDGRVDVVAVASEMSLRERWQARGRLVAGTHVPHPHISVRSATEVERTFDRPHGVWIDGQRVGEASSVIVTVRPDAFAVLV